MKDFKEIPNTNGLYLINKEGVVYSKKTHKIIYGSSTGSYMQIKINRDAKMIHRLVMLTFCPIDNPDEMTVNHLDKNTCNNRLDNLEWVTIGDNIRYNMRHPEKSIHPYVRKIYKVDDIDGEIWKETPYKNYFASNYGRLKSLINRKMSNVVDEVLIKTKPRKGDGYIRVVVVSGNSTLHQYAHRLIALTFIPNLNNKPFVNHKDGNKSNNKVENLEWATQKENAQHAMNVLGVQNMGAKHHMTKFSEEDVAMIKKIRSKGITLRQIAEIYGVELSTIGKIVTGVNWKQVKKAI